MSVQNIPQQGVSNKSLGITPNYTEQVHQKALGGTQESSGDLAAWYNEAYNFYQAVENGQATKPDQAVWDDFLEQMNWAYKELWGGGAGGGWDPMAGGEAPAPQGENAFGGTMGTNGEWVYTQKDVNIGMGEGGVHHVFGSNNNIYIGSMAAAITLTKVSQGDPAEEVYKLVVKDEATGVTEVVIFHNIEDIEKINIQAANPNQVKLEVEDGRINVEEFNGVDLSQGTPGIPEGTVIEGDTAIHEGLDNDIFPPFGHIPHHDVFGNLNLSLKGSDEVSVEKLSDGRYEITVTSREGEQTTFMVAAGNHININANPNQVFFRNGAEGPSISGELAPNGGAVSSGTTTGADGVPEGFDVSLNGETGPAEGEGVVNEGIEEWPPQLLELFEAMGIDPTTQALNISESVLNEIKTGSLPPSQNLLNALASSDPALQSAIEKSQADPESIFKKKQVSDRLAQLFSIVYPDAGVTRDYIPNFDDAEEEDVEGPDAAQLAGMIFFNGGEDAFEVKIQNGKISLSETDLNEVEGTDNDEEDDTIELREKDEDNIEKYEDLLYNLFPDADSPKDEIEKMSISDRNDLWEVLGAAENGAMPWDIQKLFPVLTKLDSRLRSALTSFSGVNASGQEHMNVRDALKSVLQKIFLDLTFSVGSGHDNLVINGREYDVVDRRANAGGFNLSDWLHWGPPN